MLKKAGIVICIAVSLVACSQPKSKIESLGKEKAAQLIQDAATASEIVMDRSHLTVGGIYESCMDAEYTKSITINDCNHLYKDMAAQLKIYPGLEKIDVSDITNSTFYHHIKPILNKNVLRAQHKT